MGRRSSDDSSIIKRKPVLPDVVALVKQVVCLVLLRQAFAHLSLSSFHATGSFHLFSNHPVESLLSLSLFNFSKENIIVSHPLGANKNVHPLAWRMRCRIPIALSRSLNDIKPLTPLAIPLISLTTHLFEIQFSYFYLHFKIYVFY